jgi:nitroimidazol reductase NimA-like FMN-containing flavoprotein (pyridoxamine 5'-phosphate oxidase superfamily)
MGASPAGALGRERERSAMAKANAAGPRRRPRSAPAKPARLKKSVASVIEWERVARVATAGPGGMPHVVPVCHVVADGRIYFASGTDARKVKNIEANPQVAVTVDLYTDAWSHLRGVLVRGRAALIASGPRFRRIRRRLYDKYPQYPDEAELDESDSVVVEVTPTHVFSWGLDE